MGNLKNQLYERLVRKNDRVRKEYERYVQGHLEEHNSKRIKHWLVLLGLRWKYRRSQQKRRHKIWLLSLKNDTARIKMEWIPGAVCYNLYRSEDGISYKFLEKSKGHVYYSSGLEQEHLYFYKFKVSLDGSRYSDFSDVLSVSTISNEELFYMQRLSDLQKEIPAPVNTPKAPRQAPSPKSASRMRLVSTDGLETTLEWTRIHGALHYNLYRTENGKDYRFLIQLVNNRYTDTTVQGSKTYHYKIKYTCGKGHYSEFPETLRVETPAAPLRKKNSGRLYEKGAESTASNRVSAMNFAKNLMSYDVISFDIFDTLLFRPFSSPSDLFILVGERLDIMDFCEIRRQAEEQARKEAQLKRGNREVTLNDIYRYVADETGIDAKQGAELEFSIEQKLCYPNPYMQAVLRLLISQGKTVVALSDMYLPKERMRELLESCSLTGFADVIVSCDYNCSKRDGGLYEILQNRYQGRLVHIGDNQKADIEMAQSKGIDTRFYQNVNEAGREFRAKNMSHLAGSAYRGMVNAHLHSGWKHYSPYYEVGYVYTGIYVMGFCQWIYRYAKEHRLDKILFLAREGDIYQKVFDRMHPDIATEYVLWSRVPVSKTIVEKNRHPYLLQLVHHKANALYKSRIGTLFDRIGIGALKNYFPEYRLQAEEFLVPANEKVVRQLLIDHWEELCECYKHDREAIRSYLERKIGDASRAAVVDVGWSGNNVLQVKYLVEEIYKKDCRISCLLAATRNVNDTYMAGMMQKQEVETYIFSNMYNKGLHDEHQEGNNRLNSFFFEILTQSCTPTFLGFGKGERFLYDIPEAENYEHNREIHAGVMDFVDEYQRHFREFPYMLDIAGHDAYMPFQYFSNNLSWLRTYFGGYLFGRDLFATQDKAVMESVSEVMKKAKIWEETT